MATFTNNTGIDNNASAVSSSFTSGLVVPATRPFDVHLVPPSKVKSKLNPAAEPFTPSISNSKDSGKSESMQASSPGKNEVKSSVNATTTTKEEGFIPPHLRFSKISIEEGPLTSTEELSVKEKIKDQAITAMKTQKKSAKEAEPLETMTLAPRVLPHLRCRTNVTKRGEVDPSHVQRSAKGKEKEGTVKGTELLSRNSALADMKENVKAATIPGAFGKPDPGLEAWLDSQEKAYSNDASANDPASLINDMLIEIDPDDSPKAGENKTVPLPPGFFPFSTKEAPVKTDPAASPTAAHDRVTYRNPTAEDEGAAPYQEVSAKTASEKEKNAIFVAEYNKNLSSVSEKYGRDSRKGSDAKEAGVDPIKYEGADPVSLPCSQSLLGCIC